jgi:hypothetical protein
VVWEIPFPQIIPPGPTQQLQLKLVTLQLSQEVCTGMSGTLLYGMSLFLDFSLRDLCLQL